jgi:hypothetical protein
MIYANKTFLILIALIASNLYALTSEQAYLQLAQSLKIEGNIQDAITNYKSVLLKNPHNKDALSDLAVIYHSQKDLVQAADYFALLAQADAQNFQAAYNAGLCYASLSKHDQAIINFQKAIALNPQDTKAHFNIGISYRKQNNHSLAASSFEKALELSPDYFDAWYNLANTFRDAHQLQGSIKAFDKALELQPTNFQLKFEKANMLTQLGNPHDAIAIYQELLSQAPNNTTLISNLAFAFKKKGDYANSIDHYKKVIAQQPNSAKAHMSIGQAYLAIGDFENGFKELLLSDSSEGATRLLKSKEQVNGKTILVPIQWCMEELVQFIRYAKLLKKYGAIVHVQANTPLVPLLKQCDYIDAIIPEGEKIGHFDYYIPLSSLAGFFNTTTHNIPCEIPYIGIPEAVSEIWHSKVRNNNTIRIGVYFDENDWNKKPAENKDIPLKAFAPFAQLQDISLYSLQAIKPEQLADIPQELIINVFGSGFNNAPLSILNMAAVIQNLDLIITRDSLVAHIAGALGRPVFVALPYTADYKWMIDRRDHPFYPTMRLFRQKTAGDWSSVIEDMISTFTTQGIIKRIEKIVSI